MKGFHTHFTEAFASDSARRGLAREPVVFDLKFLISRGRLWVREPDVSTHTLPVSWRSCRCPARTPTKAFHTFHTRFHSPPLPSLSSRSVRRQGSPDRNSGLVRGGPRARAGHRLTSGPDCIWGGACLGDSLLQGWLRPWDHPRESLSRTFHSKALAFADRNRPGQAGGPRARAGGQNSGSGARLGGGVWGIHCFRGGLGPGTSLGCLSHKKTPPMKRLKAFTHTHFTPSPSQRQNSGLGGGGASLGNQSRWRPPRGRKAGRHLHPQAWGGERECTPPAPPASPGTGGECAVRALGVE